MRYAALSMMIVLAMAGRGTVAEPADPLAARKKAWQQALEQSKFEFPSPIPNAFDWASRCDGDCKVHLILHRSQVTFKFEREGKDLVVLRGHSVSVFRISENVLCFAHFNESSHGCMVAAYSLTTGDKLWETKLTGSGDLDVHYAYSNHVTMRITEPLTQDPKLGGAIYVTGKESYGDYSEVLDLRTGKVLAYKLYRQGFGTRK